MINTLPRIWSRTISGLVLAILFIATPGVTLAPIVSAASVVASGQVRLQGTTTGIAGVRVELHTADGNFSVNATTDAGGNYSFSADLTSGTNYSVEPQALTGYNRVEPHVQSFTYTTGDAARTYNFELSQTSKTISGTVTDTTGKKITDADINFTPYNNLSAGSVSARTDANGQYSAQVIGGTWFAEVKVNLSEYTQRWISEMAPVRVDFANDATAQTSTVNFTVTPATGKVSVILLNSDGSKLTTSNFVADIDFRRADGVGTTRKVQQTDSSVSVYLTPGIYTISAYHSDLNGKSFDPAKTTFVMTDGGTVDLGTIQAEVNTGHLKGKVTNGSGQAIGNMALMAIREGSTDRVTGNTQPDGTFDLVVGAGSWSVGLNTSDPTLSQTAPVTATLTNGQTALGLNITMKTIDKTITGNVKNADGTVLTDYVGSAYVKSANKKAKITAPIVNGTFTIKYSSADVTGNQVIIGSEAADGSSYTGATEAKVNITGPTASKDLTVKPYNATLSGTLTLSTGGAMTNPGSTIEVEAVDENGNYTAVNAGNDGSFNLPLAAGTWLVNYTIADPDLTNGLINRPAAETSVTIKSGQTITKNIVVLQGTNTITGTLSKADGTVIPSAPVLVDNRPSIDNSGTAKDSSIVSVTVMTDVNGVYTAKVPNGTYQVSAGETPAVPTNQLQPDAKNVTVKGGATATANLKFETSDATIKGKVTTNGKADGGGTVMAYTDDGAQTSAPVASDGTYTLPVTSGETWHIVTTDLGNKKLLESDTQDVKAKKGSNTVNPAMKDTGVAVPGPMSKTCNADQQCDVSLPNGTSVSTPAFAVDLTGTVQLTVTPIVDTDDSSLNLPATLTYEVKARNSAGEEVSKLNSPAEISIPYDQSVAESSGLVEGRMEPRYFDPQTGTWETSGASGLVDTKNNISTIKSDHLTKFSVTGATRKAAKITKLAMKSNTNKTLTVSITGSGFSGKVSAVIGTVKASKAVVSKDGKTLTLTFSTKNLKKSTYSLVITNGNGRTLTRSLAVTSSSNKAVAMSSFGKKSVLRVSVVH